MRVTPGTRTARTSARPIPQPRALSLGALLSLGLPTLIPIPALAQSGTRAVELHADLTRNDGSAAVEIRIDFVPDDTADLNIELLGFGDGRTDGFRSPAADGPLIRFDRSSGSRQWTVIARSDMDRGVIERGDSLWRFRAAYVVRNAIVTKDGTVRVHVPVLTLALPPLRDAGNVFHAEVRVPSSWSVTEGFPTGLRATSDGIFAVDLPVAPSVVSLRARTDGVWRPGLPLLLDGLAGVVLVAFLVIGWRYLRRTSPAGGPGGLAAGAGDGSSRMAGCD